MKTKDIIKDINSNGGLDLIFISQIAKKENCTIKDYIYAYIKSSYDCSKYVAKKVADYFI